MRSRRQLKRVSPLRLGGRLPPGLAFPQQAVAQFLLSTSLVLPSSPLVRLLAAHHPHPSSMRLHLDLCLSTGTSHRRTSTPWIRLRTPDILCDTHSGTFRIPLSSAHCYSRPPAASPFFSGGGGQATSCMRKGALLARRTRSQQHKCQLDSSIGRAFAAPNLMVMPTGVCKMSSKAPAYPSCCDRSSGPPRQL